MLSSVSMKGAWEASEKSISGFHMKGEKKKLFIPIIRREIQDVWLTGFAKAPV